MKAPDITVESGPGDEPSQPPQPDDAALPEQREPKVSAAGDGDDAAAAEAEVERLRHQVDEMKARLAAQQGEDAAPANPSAGRRTGAWRPWVAGVLIAIGALLAPLSIVATWAHDEVADTDRYVASVAPLASDPAVQDAVIARITTEIFDRLDVEAVTQEAVDALAAQGLPPRVADNLAALSTPLANGVRSFVTDRVAAIVKSPTFQAGVGGSEPGGAHSARRRPHRRRHRHR